MTIRVAVAAASTLGVLAGLAASAPASATAITVTTAADATNGAVSTVAELIASPGPDGISLREAFEATNNDPGAYAIGFAPALRGKAITLSSPLPALTGGRVAFEGDADGDGKPDVTLRSTSGAPLKWGLWIASGGNRLHALTLEGFTIGVLVQPGGSTLPTHQTHAGNVVSGLVLRDVGAIGVWVVSALSPDCGPPRPQRCRSYHRWTQTTISGNTIEAGSTGIKVQLNNVGDRFEHAAVTGNSIRLRESTDGGIGFETGGDSTGARISDVLIARNSIGGAAGNGINLMAGSQRGQTGTVEKVRVLRNRIHVTGGRGYCCGGISVQAGNDDPSFTRMIRPLRYLDGNVVRNVLVRGNTMSGTLNSGVGVAAGGGAGGSRNLIRNIRIERNVIRSSTVAGGVTLGLGDGTPFMNRYAARNRIAAVTIDTNRITIGTANPLEIVDLFLGGVVVSGGGNFGRDNAISGIRITNNRIATARAGIKLIGGVGPTSHGNSVTCVHLAANRVNGTRAAATVTPNARGASGNRATLGGC